MCLTDTPGTFYLTVVGATNASASVRTLGSNLTCYAGLPQPSMHWTDPSGMSTNGPNITLTKLGHGTYRCMAWDSQHSSQTVDYSVTVVSAASK